MKQSRAILPLVVGLMLAACAQAPVTKTLATRTVNVTGHVQELAKARARQLLSGVTEVPHTLSRLHHIDVYLRSHAYGGSATPLAAEFDALDPVDGSSNAKFIGSLAYHGDSDQSSDHTFDDVKLKNLQPGEDYAVTLRGWQYIGESSQPSLVSTGDEANTTTFTTQSSSASDEQLSDQFVGFNITMTNVDFSGTASGSVTGHNGTFNTPAPSEALEVTFNGVNLQFRQGAAGDTADANDSELSIDGGDAFGTDSSGNATDGLKLMNFTLTTGKHIVKHAGTEIGVLTVSQVLSTGDVQVSYSDESVYNNVTLVQLAPQ